MDTASRLLMLLEVIEQGSFIKVAENRNVDRSIISRQISQLEDDLGVRLLNRTTRSVSLTAAGGDFIAKAQELRVLLKDTSNLAESYHKKPRGILKIAAAPLIGRRYLQPVINQFQSQYPDVEVELRMDSRMADIVSEGIDIAFRIGEPKDSTLIARKLARNRVVIAAASSFIERYGRPTVIEDLVSLPAATFISHKVKVQTLEYYDETGLLCEQKLNSVYRANDGEVLVSKAIAGDALFAAPSFIVADEIEKGLLTPILTDVKLAEYNGLYALYPHRDLAPKTRIFFEAVKAYIGETIPIWERKIPGFEHMY